MKNAFDFASLKVFVTVPRTHVVSPICADAASHAMHLLTAVGGAIVLVGSGVWLGWGGDVGVAGNGVWVGKRVKVG